MITSKVFLYKIEEITTTKKIEKWLHLGILSPEENLSLLAKEYLKLIVVRLSFADFFGIKPNIKLPFFELINLYTNSKGAPFISLSNMFYEHFRTTKINKFHVSFSYQNNYIACGLAFFSLP